MIGRQLARQPHDLDVAVRFTLQTSARRDPVEVSVDVELQKRGRMVARSSRRRRIDARKAESAKIQRLNEGIEYADQVVLGDPIFKTRRETASSDGARHRPQTVPCQPPIIPEKTTIIGVLTQPGSEAVPAIISASIYPPPESRPSQIHPTWSYRLL